MYKIQWSNSAILNRLIFISVEVKRCQQKKRRVALILKCSTDQLYSNIQQSYIAAKPLKDQTPCIKKKLSTEFHVIHWDSPL